MRPARRGHIPIMRFVAAIVLVLLLASCAEAPSDPVAEPTPAPDGDLDFSEVETVAGGLEVPWELAFVDERTILVTERPGRVRAIEDGELRADPVLEIDVRDEGEAGLLGLALDPRFPTERFAYVYYTTQADNRVSRFALDERLHFVDEEVLLDGIPAAAFHDGGRIAFGPDDLLYITTGDANGPELAADLDSLAGKILRVKPDGGIPGDNPFDSPVYSSGHRNPQGLAWSEDGDLYSSEHGPTGEFGLCCHDEVNLVEAGGFHGWPLWAGEERTPSGADAPGEHVPPIASSGPDDTWAPAGIAVQDTPGGRNLLMAGLAGEQLYRIELDGADDVAAVETAIEGLGRLRAVVSGPDGCLYLTTSNTDGRGSPGPDDDRVLRVCGA